MSAPVKWSWSKQDFGGPRFVDVGAQKGQTNPQQRGWIYWVGDDGTLWRCDRTLGSFAQVTAPRSGNVTRVAVSPDETVWCVTDELKAYYLLLGEDNGDWQEPGLLNNLRPVDVDVAADESTWFVGKGFTYAVRNRDGQLFYPTWILGIQGLSGFTSASGIEDGQFGGAWGIQEAPGGGGGQILFCNGNWAQSPPFGGRYLTDVADISTSPNFLYFVKASDGSVWTTRDGTNEIPLAATLPTPMKRITGTYTSKFSGDPALAVAADGSAWLYNTSSPT